MRVHGPFNKSPALLSWRCWILWHVEGTAGELCPPQQNTSSVPACRFSHSTRKASPEFGYLHWGTQINELIMSNLPASTANMLFTQSHTPAYLHNQKYTCSFNYTKTMSTKSSRSATFPPLYFKLRVSLQSYTGFQIHKLILRLALEAGLILYFRPTEEAKKSCFFLQRWTPILPDLQNCS